MANKFNFSFSIGFVLLINLVFTCNKKQSGTPEIKNQKPNVILLITDDQGYGDLACHGNPFIETPHLDSFYKESVRFTDFHVSPTCAPTRAALMTGRYNNRTGVWHTIAGWSLLRENEKTLGNMFSEAGYKTGAFGKWHLGDNHPYRPFERGFQETVMHAGGGVQQTPDYWGNDYFDDTYLKNGKAEKYKGYCTDVFFEEAMQFIEKHQQEPFFCYISTNAPHWPFNVPLEYVEPYEKYGDQLLDHQKRFLGMITNIDDNFGKLRKQLQALNISDNTLLIFMSDNGTAAGIQHRDGKSFGYNAGMRGTKNHKYDGGHRVPFFIYWKNGKVYGGKDITELTAHIDVLPTLAELCGIAPPKNHLPLDGKSLVPLLNEQHANWKDRVLIVDSQREQVPKKWVKTAVMTKRWRLIDGEELYDMEKDPAQQQDVASQYSEQVEMLRKTYDEWWTNTSADFANEPPFKVGTPFENPVTLTAHDWHVVNKEVPWNQFNIRKAKKGKSKIGYWTIEIVKAGRYEIQLRRYPKESGLAINASTPKITMEELPGIDSDIPKGESLSFDTAWIKLNDEILGTEKVDNTKEAVNFSIDLPKGKHKLSSAFTLKDGTMMGAYYAYIYSD